MLSKINNRLVNMINAVHNELLNRSSKSWLAQHHGANTAQRYTIKNRSTMAVEHNQKH